MTKNHRTRFWKAWLVQFVLMAVGPVGAFAFVVNCTSTKPKDLDVNCGSQDSPLCPGVPTPPPFYTVNCLVEKWYYEEKGILQCEAGTVNDNCYDSTQTYIKCACKYECGLPEPPSGNCTKGDAVLVFDEETEEWLPVCSFQAKKIQHASCIISGG